MTRNLELVRMSRMCLDVACAIRCLGIPTSREILALRSRIVGIAIADVYSRHGAGQETLASPGHNMCDVIVRRCCIGIQNVRR